MSTKKILFATLLRSVAISSNIYALNLTPHELTVAKDGPPIKRYFFQDEDKRLIFRMDNMMTVDGTTASATFRFNDLKSAGMTLSKSPMKPEMLFDQKNLEQYRSVARSFVPQNATDVQPESERSDAVPINGWTSHQFIFTYNLFGFPYRRSVTFVNYSEKEQLMFDVCGAEADYAKAYMRSYRVLNSLSELLPTSTLGPT